MWNVTQKSTAKERSDSKVTKHLHVIQQKYQQKYKAEVISESVAAAASLAALGVHSCQASVSRS